MRSAAADVHDSLRVFLIADACTGQGTHARRAARAVQGPQLTQDLAMSLGDYEGYVNSASKHLIASVKAGKAFPDAAKEDDQAHSLIKVPLVVARYIGALRFARPPPPPASSRRRALSVERVL